MCAGVLYSDGCVGQDLEMWCGLSRMSYRGRGVWYVVFGNG